MSGRDGLTALLGIKRREERSAANALRAAQERLGVAAAHLETLRRYADDYRGLAERAGAELLRVRDAQRFLLQLEQNLEAQRAAVEREQQNVEHIRARWRDVRVQRESMDKLLARRAEAEAIDRQRAEQRQADDRAGGRFRKG
jgi:flagellar export protein FliJ